MSRNIIICAKREDPFARVPKTILSDQRLSWKAKGILAYLLGKPAGWKVRRADLEKQSTDGREAVSTGLKELQTAGYAELVRLTNERGQVLEWVWKISDSPIFKPDTGFPDVDNPDVGNPSHSKKECSKNEYSKNQPKESKEHCVVPPQRERDEAGEHESQWKPNPDGKQRQLSKLPTTKTDSYPSQREFEAFCESENLTHTLDAYRPDIYLELCKSKWHQWRVMSNRWVPIFDWQAYVRGLHTRIEEAKCNS